MIEANSPPDRTLHPSPEHGLLDCPDCDTTVVGSYSDLILHYLDEHPLAGQEDPAAAEQDALARIKRAQQEARRER